MKKLLATASILFCILAVDAQIVRIDTVTVAKTNYKKDRQGRFKTQTEFLYSGGLIALSYSQMPKVMNEVNSERNIAVPFPGLMFKVNDNQLSYRLIGTYFEKEKEFFNDCPDCERTTGDVKNLALKIGFEKNITYSLLQPYFGTDLGFRRSKFIGTSQNAGSVAYTVPYDVVAEKVGGTLTPFLGLKYNITGSFTIGAEAGLDLMYSYEKQEKNYHDANRTRTFVNYYKFEFLSRPLSMLALQYNFGK